jgi:hypothetical protein
MGDPGRIYDPEAFVIAKIEMAINAIDKALIALDQLHVDPRLIRFIRTNRDEISAMTGWLYKKWQWRDEDERDR